jgi:hypothetical protein
MIHTTPLSVVASAIRVSFTFVLIRTQVFAIRNSVVHWKDQMFHTPDFRGTTDTRPPVRWSTGVLWLPLAEFSFVAVLRATAETLFRTVA